MIVGVFSFFSGAGFLDLGFELSGFDVLYASEISAAFSEAYSYSRQCLGISAPQYGFHTEEKGDIRELIRGHQNQYLNELICDARSNTDIIGFIGGSPCPDFSVGGKNRGRNGDYGKLSDSYVELICQQQPDFFVFENVKGLWRTKLHKAFYEELKYKLYQAGYILTERLINAIEYGVPQNRERIILVGFKDSLLANLGFEVGQTKNISEDIFPWNKHTKYRASDVFSAPWTSTSPFREDSILECPSSIDDYKELTVEFWFNRNNVLNHPNAEDCFKPRNGYKRFISVDEGDDSRKSFKRLHRWRYSPTVCYGNNEVHLHPYKARRISVAEALALQSLPEEFSLPKDISLTSMFKTIGNGVPYLASKGVAETIFDFLNSPHLPLSFQTNERQLTLAF